MTILRVDGCHRRRGNDDVNRVARECVMRHFLRRRLGHTALPLSGGVLACALARALVGGAGAAQRLSTADRATVTGAVDLATIARRADVDFAAAARADKEAEADVRLARALGMRRRQKTCPAHVTETMLA
jgi:predicted ABC-type transport system involved in lysophospholipase L1 biosynthesis ATPase subunit